MAYATLEDMYGSVELVIFSRLLEGCRHLVRTGQVVIVRGRISAREDEEPRILAASLEAAPAPDAISVSVQSVPNEMPAPTEPLQSAQPAPPPAKPITNPGLYLRLPSMDSPQWLRVKKLLRVMEGKTPVYLRLEDPGKLVRVPSELWITPESVLIEELQCVLGKDNVAKVW